MAAASGSGSDAKPPRIVKNGAAIPSGVPKGAKLSTVGFDFHEGEITFIKLNREGDLLFSCARKEDIPMPSVTNLQLNERIGTYDGHRGGTVWSCDVTPDSKWLVTAGADESIKIWEVETGRMVLSRQLHGVARYVEWAPMDPASPQLCFAVAVDDFMERPAHVCVIPFDPKAAEDALAALPEGAPHDAAAKTATHLEALLRLEVEGYPDVKANQVRWTRGGRYLLVCYDDGSLRLWNSHTGAIEKVRWPRGAAPDDDDDPLFAHPTSVRGVAFNSAMSLALTFGAGTLVGRGAEPREAEILLWNMQPDPTRIPDVPEDSEDPDLAAAMAQIEAPPALSLVKTFATDAPFMHTAAFVPDSTLFICAGGRESKMQSQLGGEPKNEVRVYDIVSGKEVAKVGRYPRAHFGPVNCLLFHPDGRRFYSASEDGYIKVHDLPERWFELCSQAELDAPGVTAATRAAQRAFERIQERARAIMMEEEAEWGAAEEGKGEDDMEGPISEEAMSRARAELGITEMAAAEAAYDAVVQSQVAGGKAKAITGPEGAASGGGSSAMDANPAEDD